MRTKHLLMAIATLLVAGCSQNEITEVRTGGNPTVGFDVYTGVATRGTDVSTTTMQGTCDETHYGGFGIMGYYTGSKNWDEAKGTVTPSFMFNQKVTYDTNANEWTYSPTKYWPNNTTDKVSFFAYAPYESNVSGGRVGIVTSQIDDTGIPSIDFTLKEATKIDEMVDLVVAEELNKTAQDEAIQFNFRHTLSKINFKAKLGADYSGLDGTSSFIYITHMWIIGQKGGSLSFDQTNKLTNENSKFYTKATWKDLHWDYENATIAEGDYSIEKIMKMEEKEITEIWADGTEKSIKGIILKKGNKETPVDLFKKDQYLYLIPINDNAEEVAADGAGGCTSGDIQIGFHYDIVSKTADSSDDNPKYAVSHLETAVSLPANHMKRGKFYTYTFTISLKEIKVSAAKVNDWGSVTGNFDVN